MGDALKKEIRKPWLLLEMHIPSKARYIAEHGEEREGDRQL